MNRTQVINHNQRTPPFIIKDIIHHNQRKYHQPKEKTKIYQPEEKVSGYDVRLLPPRVPEVGQRKKGNIKKEEENKRKKQL